MSVSRLRRIANRERLRYIEEHYGDDAKNIAGAVLAEESKKSPPLRRRIVKSVCILFIEIECLSKNPFKIERLTKIALNSAMT